jgi:carboxylesterase type B
MLFFYGGSWDTGSAMFPLYDGERISAQGDVIFVAANYRLNRYQLCSMYFIGLFSRCD